MRINAVVGGDEPEVSTEVVAAQAVQPWMLLLVADHDGDDVQVVAVDPQPFQQEGPAGRPERWVTIDVVDAEPVTVLATAWLEIVFGAEPDTLQPLLDPDLYATAEEALARNGMCHEHLPVEGDEEVVLDEQGAEPPPVYCARPSDPHSFYRLCAEHDASRLAQSQIVVSHGFNPTYAAIAAID